MTGAELCAWDTRAAEGTTALGLLSGYKQKRGKEESRNCMSVGIF